jgi:hypothetical protein
MIAVFASAIYSLVTPALFVSAMTVVLVIGARRRRRDQRDIAG